MSHTVGDVAKLAHVSVRTLHHYDEIGLLKPSGRTVSGYRLYADRDLERLQQILFFRELGFALDDVARVLDDPAFDRKRALVTQRALLVEKGERIRTMVALVDRTLDAMEKGTVMKKEEMFEVFGDFDPEAHEEEAEERWGDTASYAEAARRTKRYTKEDWKGIKAEAEEIAEAFSQALGAGRRADEAAVLALAERSRLHIDKWYYPCSRRMHAALGQMYVSDPRFADGYEKRRAGLAQFVCDAIHANAERARG
jgi:DNA-binding transcriptional MerR regulator